MDNLGGLLNGKCECGYLIQDCCCRAGETSSEQVLKKNQKIHEENILEIGFNPKQAILDAMQEYADLCQAANLKTIEELRYIIEIQSQQLLNLQSIIDGPVKTYTST